MDFGKERARTTDAMVDKSAADMAHAMDRAGIGIGGQVSRPQRSVLSRLDGLEKQLCEIRIDVAATFSKITGDSVEWADGSGVELVGSGETHDRLARIEAIVGKMAAVIARTNMAV